MIDAAHDLGVLSADFCKLYHSDRMSGSYCLLLDLTIDVFQIFFLLPIFSIASDYNTTIYTMATSGTDHVGLIE